MKDPFENSRFESAFLLIWALCAFLRIPFHELWRDEWGVWLIASVADSPSDMTAVLKYGGHPWLWPGLVYAVSRVSSSVTAMQVLHAFIALAAVALLIFKSPFSRLQKILLSLGYLPFFEYCIVSRTYGLGMLFIFLACALYCQIERLSVCLALVLGLLAHCSIYGAMISLALTAAALLRRMQRHSAHRSEYLLFLGVYAALLVVSLLIIHPPVDAGFHPEWFGKAAAGSIAAALSQMTLGLMPLQVAGTNLWSESWRNGGWGAAYPMAALAYMAVLTAALWSRKDVLLFFWSANLALFCFSLFKYFGYPRHAGHYFLVLVAAAWLIGVAGSGSSWRRWANLVWIFLISAQAAVGLYVSWRDIVLPFSGAPEATRYIVNNNLTFYPLAAYPSHPASAVAGYLGKSIYYLSYQRFGTNVIWNDQQRALTPPELNRDLRNYACKEDQKVLFITNQGSEIETAGMQLLHQTSSAMVADEQFFLYLVSCS